MFNMEINQKDECVLDDYKTHTTEQVIFKGQITTEELRVNYKRQTFTFRIQDMSGSELMITGKMQREPLMNVKNITTCIVGDIAGQNRAISIKKFDDKKRNRSIEFEIYLTPVYEEKSFETGHKIMHYNTFKQECEILQRTYFYPDVE